MKAPKVDTQTIEPKDVVTGIRKGGNFMQVLRVTDAAVTCFWADSEAIRVDTFRADTLKVAIKHQCA
jgi:uncharacterized protein YodC (DUF2158 family)